MGNADTYIDIVSGAYPSHDLYFSVHHKVIYTKNGKEEIGLPGQAFRKISQAVSNAFYWTQKGHDVYLAMGGQKETKETEVTSSKNGKKYIFSKAVRKQYNTILCSSLYIDMDVKEGEYSSTKEAMINLKEFIKTHELPLPTMIIASGTGGLHVYWTAEELFSSDIFFNMSRALSQKARDYGLKFDEQCTNDICRLLRIPDTWNFKKTPASPVKLLYSGGKIPLSKLKDLFYDQNYTHISPAASNADDNDELSTPRKQYELVDMNKVVTFCPFLHNTLMSGGKEQKEPIWKMAITLASYCKDGREFAHKMSSGHGAYSKEETDNKYDQCEQDKRNNFRLGPPHCATISNMGVSECSNCNYLPLKTTPLNIPAFNNKPVITINSHNSDLPFTYYRGKGDTIYLDNFNKETGQNDSVSVFPYPIMYNSAFAEGGEKEYQFVFTTFEGNGREKVVKIPMASASDKTSLSASLAKSGLPMILTEPTRKFMTSFMSQLRSNDKTLILTSPLGWHTLPSKETGFSFNGRCYFKGGSFKAQRLEGDFAKHYSVYGSDTYWKDLVDFIVLQNRPEINTIIAASFGAPLINFTGHSGCALGIWSSQSGIGKSTALALAQAVWGSTIRMSGLNDTLNQTIDTMATLKSIVCCWDELKGQQQIQQFAQIIFELSRGREKGRLDRSSKPMTQREFETLLVFTANQPLADEVASKVKGSSAGNFRMLEFNADENFTSNLSVTTISSLVGELRRNYGHIGETYAKYLGENHDKLKDLVVKVRDHFEDLLKGTQAERYWISTISCIYVGARIANGLTFTKFDLVKLKDFLIKIVEDSRVSSTKTGNADLSRAMDTSLLLGEMLHHYGQQTIKTDTIAQGVGRPRRNSIKVLNDNGNMGKQNIVIQISKQPLLCRVSDPSIGQWCKVQGMPKSAFINALQKHYNATSSRGRIGSGTDYVSPPILIWEMDLSDTSLGQEIEF